jgi:type VII secretion-associated serine protease mycosin
VTEAPWAAKRYDLQTLSQFGAGAGVTVAVIDSGVDPNHPQLQGRVLGGVDYLDRPAGGLQDCIGHGTAVASLIVGGPANNRFRGLAPGARVMSFRVSEQELVNGNVTGRTASPADFADAINQAVGKGAQVINLSVVLTEDNPAVRQAVANAVAHNVVVVAAAGNSHDQGNPTPYPAAYEGVIGVGAVDNNSVRLAESQTGKYVDLVAPGADITAANPGGGFQTSFHGTSFAVPFVSATAALLIQSRKGISANDVAKRLFATADPAPGAPGSEEYGYGVLDPYRALTDPLTTQRPRVPVALPVPTRDAKAEAAAAASARTRKAALLLAGGVGLLAVLVVVLANVVPRGRRRGWRPGAA